MFDLESYWRDEFPSVEGWVDNRLFPFVQVLGQTQETAGIKGNVAEIGVFQGKFLIALAHLAAEGDKITGIDVFDDQERNIDGAGAGSRDLVLANIARFGPRGLDYELIKADSLALSLADKADLQRKRGPFRLFSVDGCHTMEHTHQDLVTAQESLAAGGVVILDDYMQPHWPGVTEAVSAFYSRSVPRIKPFLYTCHKLFFVGYGWHDYFFRAFQDNFGSRPESKVCKFFGSDALVCYP